MILETDAWFQYSANTGKTRANLGKCKLRESTKASAVVSARMVTYRSWNDHDHFERFIIGNRFQLLY